MFQKSTFKLTIAATLFTLLLTIVPSVGARPPVSQTTYQANEARKILASTLRFEMRSGMILQDGVGVLKLWGVGHGTVKDGRYLVTHNHFDHIVFSDSLGHLTESVSLSFYRADGSLLTHLTNHPATAQISAETIVFDFGAGFFDAQGVPSASFVSNAAGLIRPNATVAQINWNQTQAFVEWTTVRAITSHDGTPAVELNNDVIKGASGGGIFLNGHHIANNWKVVSTTNVETGIVSDSYTVGALN